MEHGSVAKFGLTTKLWKPRRLLLTHLFQDNNGRPWNIFDVEQESKTRVVREHFMIFGEVSNSSLCNPILRLQGKAQILRCRDRSWLSFVRNVFRISIVLQYFSELTFQSWGIQPQKAFKKFKFPQFDTDSSGQSAYEHGYGKNFNCNATKIAWYVCTRLFVRWMGFWPWETTT